MYTFAQCFLLGGYMKQNLQWIKKYLLLSLSVCLLFLAGCSTNQDNNASNANNTRVITDTAGHQVTVKKDVNRLAVVPIPWASIVYAIDGSGSKIVGMHPSAKASYEASLLKSLAPELGQANTQFVSKDFAINLEESGKLNLDAMIVWDYQEKELEQLKSVGIPAIALKYGTLEDLQNGMLVVGQLLNKEEQAQKLVDYHKESLKYFNSKQEALKNVKKPKVLYLYDQSLKVATNGTVNNLMIEMAGGENAAKDVPGKWVNVTMEQILEWNPDIIILSNFSNITPEDIKTNKFEGHNWSNVSAIKSNQVFKAPMGIYRWDAPSAETPLMMKWMAQKIQPTIVNDYEIKTEIKDFYHNFLKYDLNDDELGNILQLKLNVN